MSRDELSAMRAFLEVAERGSFARAAAHLGITASALSQTIQRLEERLGVRLLQRTTRSVAATAAGQELLRRLRPAMDGFDEALDALNDFRDTPVGAVRLTLSRVASELVLEPRLAELRERYPRVRLEVAVEDRVIDIVGRRFDAGIRRRSLVESEMVAHRLTKDDHLLAVAAPSYVARRGAPERPEELHAHDGICIRRGKSETIPAWRFVGADGAVHVVEPSPALVVDDAHLARQAAVSGGGIAYLAAAYVERFVREGALVALLPGWSAPLAGFFLFYPSRHHVPAPLRALATVLRTRPPKSLVRPGAPGSSS